MTDFLITLINTLNNIEVHGEDNLDRLLSCIIAAKQKLHELEGGEMNGEQTD